MFSNRLKKLLAKIQFGIKVLPRIVIILFRQRKRIQIFYLNYQQEHLFDKSYVIINYRFRNAIYYRFGNHYTLEKQIKIFDIQNSENEFDFTVYGLFQKETYRIKFKPELSLNTSDFKTEIKNIKVKMEEHNQPKLSPNPVYIKIEKPIISLTDVNIKPKNLTIKKPTFNPTDFI